MIPKRLIERTWFRSLPLILGGVLLLLIVFGVAVAVRWHMAAEAGEDPVLISEPVYVQDGSPAAEPAIGTHFAAVLKYRLPWSDSFKVAAAEPGVNLQLTADPVIRRTGVHWGYFDWTLTVPLQAYRSGESGGGSVFAEFFAGKNIETPLPELKIADVALPLDDTGADLSLAPRIDVKNRRVSILTAAIIATVVILIALAVWVLLARKKREAARRAVPIWERAIEAIRALRDLVANGKASPELAVADLTDVVRRYLEARFHLRAERQTTSEFLADLERNDSLLEEKDRKFLRSFLASADMVKFARLPADPELFERASVKAEELISGTIPDAEAGLSSNTGGRK